MWRFSPPNGSSSPELPICAQATRTERAHRTSGDATCGAHHIGTYALVAFEAQIAGYEAAAGGFMSVVMCVTRDHVAERKRKSAERVGGLGASGDWHDR